MKINDKGLNLIKQFEGCKLNVYLCPAGVKTVGYGHTGADVNKKKIGDSITQATADKYLKSDIEKFEKKVEKYNPIYNFTADEFSALVSFCFNIGNIDQLTNNGTRSKKVIAEKILLYNKAGGRVLQGLVRRRKAERDLFIGKC